MPIHGEVFILQDIRTLLECERCLDSHCDADAFVLVLLTHGNQGYIFGTDGEKVSIDHITTMFDGKHCPQLQNKPKLFIVQACQGSECPLFFSFFTLLVGGHSQQSHMLLISVWPRVGSGTCTCLWAPD